MTLLDRLLFATLICAACISAQAVEVRFQRVADGVYAHIGDKGARTAENEGLNANIGLVVTPAGAVLIDAGATFSSARDIHAAVKLVTAQPLKWVFNASASSSTPPPPCCSCAAARKT